MKIVIFGATGKTGTLLLEQTLAKGHQVTAYVRNSQSIKNENKNLRIVVGNLSETLKIKDALAGAEACFSTLGGNSLTKRSPELVSGIDNIVRIAEQEVVPRFIYLSSFGAGDSKKLMPAILKFFMVDLFLRVPLADHNINEQRIMNSKLQWTLVRPGGLTQGPLTGNVSHGTEAFKQGKTSISRADVAAFMLAQLQDSTYNKKAVWLFEK
ncbi:MAG: NAD(P)-binding oxidoreductase [Paludibacter sp.]